MNFDYKYKITFKLNEPFDIDYIQNVCKKYPGVNILVEVQNTKGITSKMIRQLGSNIAIRIAGGYDSDRIARYGKDIHWSKPDYFNAVIYSKNETIKILEEIEKIESGISTNWSSIQKLIYIYDRLKTGIMYDPKYEQKLSNEIRSLRCLITKQTVCAGYALTLKEFMDRNDINCEYVEGYTHSNSTGGHAWNIVGIDEKKYPIDLTWDNTKFRSGDASTFDFLGQDIKTFSKSHYPLKGEKTQNYIKNLSQLPKEIIKQMSYKIGRARDYKTTTYYGTRKDGSKFIVAQIGNSNINNQNYYRYYYADILPTGEKQAPLILYSDTNVTHLVNCKRFNKPIPPRYEETVDNILFSKENIADSLSKRTYYIGKVRKSEPGNKFELVSSTEEIQKQKEKNDLFVYPTKRYKRSDGSVFIAQQMFEQPHKANGIDVMRYDIFEMVSENGQDVLKRNTVFTEKNFFKDTRQSMVDDYLNRERLNRKVSEAGGYIGYYDSNGIRMYNPNLVSFFSTSKKIDINSLDKSDTKQDEFTIPSFEELKDLALKYELVIDSSSFFETDISKFKIREITSGKVQTDNSIIDKALLANIWLTSAGVKYYVDEQRPGSNYAFNDQAEKLYNLICEELKTSIKNNGVIDTVDLFKNIEYLNNYKYNREILVNLFRTPYQTEVINKLFLNSQGITEQRKAPKPLYNMNYAGNLVFNNMGSGSAKR